MSKSRQKLQSPQHDYCNFLQVQNYIDNLCFDKQMVLEILNRANPLGKRCNPCYWCERSWIQIVSDLTIHSLNAPAQYQIYHALQTYSQHKNINFTTMKCYAPQNVERTLRVGKFIHLIKENAYSNRKLDQHHKHGDKSGQ